MRGGLLEPTGVGCDGLRIVSTLISIWVAPMQLH